ncbi:MAG: oxygen-independent coproporphyrinogen III oxidase [Alphaproteobacteria bacterium]|nr:oxygen-independent coproporphyrinogen III oxidase [Alphaproteobacteria bacterium]
MTDKKQLQDALLKRNEQVPRYTSYPTAPHFSADVGPKEVKHWLEDIADEANLSLYFHIPFCRKMCWYCGCNTKATRRYDPVNEYMDYLWREIDMVASSLSGGQLVTHIHFGGGSPSMLKPEDFTRLMATIRKRFHLSEGVEIAIELDPREITEAKVAAYALAGVNRASLGVQDFHDHVQKAINRRQPFHTIYDAVNLLKAYGISDINMDLLYGLPHQTEKDLQENADYAAALGAQRISLFGYAHVPWMKKHMRLIDENALADGAGRLAQFDIAAKQLEKRGYVPIGLDHFVLPRDPMAKALNEGNLHRNFQGYTTDSADTLIGFGASAISALPQGYTQNTPATRQYFDALERGEMATVRGKALSNDDRIRRAAIEKLMCYFELDLAHLAAENQIAFSHFDDALETLAELATSGLVEINGTKVRVPGKARQAVRLACAAFDTYFSASKQRHAQVA